MKILVIGSTNTDMVVKAPHLPKPGETILGGKFLMNPGGKGANQAVAAARLGGVVTFIGKIGNDLFGKQAVSNLKNEAINVDNMLSDPANPSGVALITVDEVAENCIVVAPGSNMTITKNDIDNNLDLIEQTSIVLMQLEIPIDIVAHTTQIAHQRNKLVILNPAPANELPDELLKQLYILTPNETEAEIITGISAKDDEGVKKAAMKIREKGVQQVIITLGSRGAYLLNHEKSIFIRGKKVNAIDTTAAGDTFNGALTVALSEGKEIEKAIEFANTAASIAVTRMGAQSSVPYRKELY